MALAPGTRLGVYEILTPIGAGGMGEVYQARDTRLKRDVALKVLPDHFAQDTDRLARFQREAELLATLNHPNIAGIYGLEESNGVRALVLELVEGPTLADRIAKGPIPLDDALPIARQIAEALDAAHEKGVIHRDLKPANIKLRDDGSVKILDFGLAKLAEPGGSLGSASVTGSPTITSPALTMAGVIFGTAAYMSPEQARGRRVDKRTDIWAFGCVLYEMVTGKRAFDGEDVTEAIAAIVKSEPDWSALPPEVTAQIRLLLKRCLEKDPRTRIGDISTVRFLLTEALPASDAQSGPSAMADGETDAGRRRLRRAIASVTTVALAIVVTVFATSAWLKLREHAPQPIRFVIAPPPDQLLAMNSNIAISADGSRIVYRTVTQDGRVQLMQRAIGDLEPRPLAGTTGGQFPFVSPDGRWIGFFAGGELRKMPVLGGGPVTLCQISANPRGASWGADDTIVFATTDPTTGLLSVPAAGGEPKVLTKPDVKRGEDHWFPSFLPDARGLLFTIFPVDRQKAEDGQVALLDLQTGHSKVLIRGGSDAAYTDVGYVVYGSKGTLQAVRFDSAKREVIGDSAPVVEQVMTEGTFAASYFALSRSGTLVYVPGNPGGITSRSLVWVNRRGQEEPIDAPVRAYTTLRLSPDGTRVALDVRDQQNDIWIWDLSRRTLTPLTFDPATDRNPVWTPDGSHIIFASTRDAALALYRQAANGTGSVERLTTSATAGSFQLPMTVSPDGTRLVLNQSGDLAVLRLDASNASTSRQGDSPQRGQNRPTGVTPGSGSTSSAEVLFRTPVTEDNAELSPDGRWLAYQSPVSGLPQVYVRPFPNVNDGLWQVSTGGGVKPAWASNGRELFYVAPGNAFMSVPITPSSSTFIAGNPAKLFDTRFYYSASNRTYDVAPDGQRFIVIKENTPKNESGMASANLVVVVNWTEELKRRVPTK